MPARANARSPVLLICLALLMAALACNVPGSQRENPQATIGAVYGTITAQAGGTASPLETVVTWTPAPTSIQTTATPTPPQERAGNGANLTLPRCQRAITVDGSGSGEVIAGQPGYASFNLDTNTYGASQWQSASDLSGAAAMCWGTSGLHLVVTVTDDAHVQTQRGATSWQGDEVELLFDADLRGDFFDDVWNNDDTQLGLSPGDFAGLGPIAVRYHPTVGDAPGVQVAARQDGTGYVLEALVAWSALGASGQEGSRYGLCVALSDNDHAGAAQQDSMVSHCTRLLVPDPTTWVTVVLGL